MTYDLFIFFLMISFDVQLEYDCYCREDNRQGIRRSSCGPEGGGGRGVEREGKKGSGVFPSQRGIYMRDAVLGSLGMENEIKCSTLRHL